MTSPDHPERPVDLRDLRDPVVVAAFGGWNDAGGAATQVIEHLIEVYDGEFVHALDPDDFYDFQVNRPQVSRPSPTEREITWPTTELYVVRTPEHDLLLIHGLEPNLRWRSFCTLLVSAIRSSQATRMVLLGSLLADAPHTRPVPVTGSTDDLCQAEELGLELSAYEGPTGIIGVLGEQCSRAGLEVISLWAAVPHYVAQPPCPKASLALMTRLEDVLNEPLELGDLPEFARAWERGVDELAAEDLDVGEYVASLEHQVDAAEIPEASGDAIAAEFQRYLRRRQG